MTFFLFFRISQNASYHSDSLSKLFSLSISFYPNSPCSIFFFLSCKKNSALQFCVVFCWLNNGNSIKAPFGKFNFYSSSSYMKLIDSSVKKSMFFFIFVISYISFCSMAPFSLYEKRNRCGREGLQKLYCKTSAFINSVFIYILSYSFSFLKYMT